MIWPTDLETMDRTALVTAWRNLFGSVPPKSIGRAMLRRFLAFELQARRQGGLSRQAAQALRGGECEVARKAKVPALKPGGRLVREWNGVTHIIDVTDDGFLWKGQTWRSLSVIAREITGAHWSGPRFFGLNGKGKA